MSERIPRTSVRDNTTAVGRLVSSFDKIRVLNCVSIRPRSGLELLTRLRRHHAKATPNAANRVVGRLVRLGWLKKLAASSDDRSGGQYTLTAEGRRVLKVAREGLRQLVAKSSGECTRQEVVA